QLSTPLFSNSSCSPRSYSLHRTPLAPHPFPTRRSSDLTRLQHHPSEGRLRHSPAAHLPSPRLCHHAAGNGRPRWRRGGAGRPQRSEEHTSELQSRENIVCRLLLEKKNRIIVGKAIPSSN